MERRERKNRIFYRFLLRMKICVQKCLLVSSGLSSPLLRFITSLGVVQSMLIISLYLIKVIIVLIFVYILWNNNNLVVGEADSCYLQNGFTINTKYLEDLVIPSFFKYILNTCTTLWSSKVSTQQAWLTLVRYKHVVITLFSRIGVICPDFCKYLLWYRICRVNC